MAIQKKGDAAPIDGSGENGNGENGNGVAWWRTRRARTTFAALGILAFAGLIGWWFGIRPYVSTDDARIAAVIVRVANQGASARIEKMNVTEGSRVRKGTVVVELDHQVAAANLERAKARASLSAAELWRMQDLAAHQGASRQQLDKARADAQMSDADLQLAQLAYDRTFLKSDVDGIVVQKPTEVGNILETNQTAVTVADIEHAWVAANIEETEVARVKQGDRVRISVDEGGSLTGSVLEVRQAVASQFALIPPDNAQGNFIKLVQRVPVKIALDPHPGRVLRVGQSVEVRIRTR